MPPDFIVAIEDDGLRLDIFLTKKFEDFSRSKIQDWIKRGAVTCGSTPVHSSRKIRAGEQITVDEPDDINSVKPEDIPLQTMYEDRDMMAVYKPAGMVTHPAKGHRHGTLANAVVHLMQSSRGKHPASSRMGLVHRLDKDTSGILLIGKNRETAEKLSHQFKDRSVSKIYRTIVYGKVTSKRGRIVGSLERDYDSGKIAIKTSGRYSETLFKVLGIYGAYSYLEVYPRTGRTHQIRVHLSQIGHPVMGDTVYGGENALVKRQMLHAYSVEFKHPRTGRRQKVSAPLPADFLQALKSIKSPAGKKV